MSNADDKPIDFQKTASKIAKLLEENTQNMLKAVKIRGSGDGFYYSVSHKSFIKMPKFSEMYLLPIEKDENNNYYVFSNYLFKSGAIIIVHEDELEMIGYN